MERTIGFLIGLCLCLRAFWAQPLQVPAAETQEKESYEIYSTVLQAAHPNIREWVILNKTRGYEFCPPPAPDQDSLYRSMLDDYARKNKTTMPLERKFSLDNYLLVSDTQGAGNTKPSNVVVFSSVGFNPERTRAAVCFWANSYGTCSVLVKSEGIWRMDKDWRGGGCFWAY